MRFPSCIWQFWHPSRARDRGSVRATRIPACRSLGCSMSAEQNVKKKNMGTQIDLGKHGKYRKFAIPGNTQNARKKQQQTKIISSHIIQHIINAMLSASSCCSMVSGTSSCSLSSMAVAPSNVTGLRLAFRMSFSSPLMVFHSIRCFQFKVSLIFCPTSIEEDDWTSLNIILRVSMSWNKHQSTLPPFASSRQLFLVLHPKNLFNLHHLHGTSWHLFVSTSQHNSWILSARSCAPKTSPLRNPSFCTVPRWSSPWLLETADASPSCWKKTNGRCGIPLEYHGHYVHFERHTWKEGILER